MQLVEDRHPQPRAFGGELLCEARIMNVAAERGWQAARKGDCTNADDLLDDCQDVRPQRLWEG